MLKMRQAMLAAALATGILGAGAVSAEAQQRTLTFAHVLEQNHPYHLMAVRFAEEIAANEPSLKVEVYPAGQLGDERTLIEALQTGSVDIATVTSALTANFVPQFRAFSLPFLFRDVDHLFAVMESDIGDELAQEMSKKGLVKLGYAYGGARDLYTHQPVRNLDELKGLKVRTMENPAIVATWNKLGAVSTPISWNDVYVSLQQKLVDGGEGTGVSYKSMNFNTVAPHYTRINYIFSWHNLMMAKSTFDSLTPAQQQAVLKAGDVAVKYERKLFLEREDALFDELRKIGVTVHQPSDAADWSQRAASVIDAQADSVGGKAWIERIRAVR
ncbi:TRAP transporter substrate-binding protein [Oceanibaculum nanhaiense]|uniref:TRAP transporter substrate-binding protein n=1 Tax=Oceanibaculum nanhaiense TaxID=1909734 RepID=UPI00396EB8F3